MLTIPLHIHSLLRESFRYLACHIELGQAPVSLCHVRSSAKTCSCVPRCTPHLSTRTCAAVQELTHPVIVVTDFDDGLVLPEIPHGSSAARAGGREDVLDLPVPCDAADVLKRLSHTENSMSQPFKLKTQNPLFSGLAK